MSMEEDRLSVSSYELEFGMREELGFSDIEFSDNEEEKDDKIYTEFYHALLQEQKNIFLTGPGGSGKSTLIHDMVQKLAGDMNTKYKKVAITSTTGVSAVSIGGSTIHAWSGVGISKTPEEALRRCKYNKCAIQKIKECSILVIDEISMAGCNLLDILDYVFRKIRCSMSVFGGIQVIMTGDFLQLPPVNERYAFHSTVWKELDMTIIHLTKLYRYTDPIYSDLLMRVRTATHTKEDVSLLKKRKKAYEELDLDNMNNLKVKPTFLYSRCVNVDQKNIEELEKNPNQLHTITSTDTIVDDDKNVMTNVLDHLAPKTLYLKIGAQVMLKKNMDVKEGLCNGSRGVVTKIASDHSSITVLFLNQKEILFEREYYQHTTIEDNKEKVKAVRHQFPFILAYALTIHKSQGSSIDCAIIDAGEKVFGPHMTYVALSRVRSLQGLYLKDFKSSRIKVETEVIDFMKEQHLI